MATTKVIILGEQEPKVEKKPIEFVKTFIIDNAVMKAVLDLPTKTPSYWSNIILLAKAYDDTNYDLMFAYNDNKANGNLYLGHFNDGVV